MINDNASPKWRCAISVWISSWADTTHSGAYLTFGISTSLEVDVILAVLLLARLVFVAVFLTFVSAALTGRLGGCGAWFFFFFIWLNFKATSNLSIHSFFVVALMHWKILESSGVITFIAFLTPSKSLILITAIFVASYWAAYSSFLWRIKCQVSKYIYLNVFFSLNILVMLDFANNQQIIQKKEINTANGSIAVWI